MMNSWVVYISITTISVIVAMETFIRIRCVSNINSLFTELKKSISMVKSSEISDHLKEKALRQYAWNIIIQTTSIIFKILLLILVFSSVYFAAGTIIDSSNFDFFSSIISLEVQLIVLFASIAYAIIRRIFFQGNYSPVSKTLHYIALNFQSIKQAAFDIDSNQVKKISKPTSHFQPVFVTGLARAGTTILLRAIYSTNKFSTLTYRDMPFVMAPYLWSKLSQNHYKSGVSNERAHKDQMKINFDSPEAFEEVFWLTFTGKGYIKDHGISPYTVKNEVINKFRQYVTNVINRHEKVNGQRYLSKNNNNLLRFSTICKAFPDALIIVLFRNPYDHACSLLRQHGSFCKLQDEDPFILKYMNWLGHFEFGRNFKPFLVGENVLPKNTYDTMSIDYWLKYWTDVYRFTLEQNIQNTVYFDYDQFASYPLQSLDMLSRLLSVEEVSLKSFASYVNTPKKYDFVDVDKKVLYNALKTHEKLIWLCVNKGNAAKI